MARRAVALLCAGALGVAAAQREEAPAPGPQRAEVVLAEADRVPLTLLWKVEATPVTAIRLPQAPLGVALPPGSGCLVAVRAGFAPVPLTMALAPGETRRLEPFAWRAGVGVVGTVAGPTGEPLLAEVRVETSSAAGVEEPADLCARALREGRVTTVSTDDTGAFALGPFAPGTWNLSVSAAGHETVRRRLVTGAEPVVQNAGTTVLREVAELEVSFDLARVGEVSPYRLTVSRRRPRGADRDRRTG